MRVRLDSIGCRLNIGEIEELARELARAGHRIVGPGEAVDLLVFNTCAVTHVASRKSRKQIRQFRRDSPDAFVVATGCYATLAPDQVDDTGVDLIVDNTEKDGLLDRLEEEGILRDADPIPTIDAPSFLGTEEFGRTRAFVKVQDGCDNRCTFCVVTLARGAGRSRRRQEVIAEVRRLVAAGHREVVLSGVHLGSYGHDRGEARGLQRLVEEILGRTGVERLRLSSLEPWDLDAGFFELWEDPRLLPHLHLPLQSGCDATLRRMSRRSDTASFAALVDAARRAIPDLSVTTDVIVGFPGETEEEFRRSLEFVRESAFTRLHVFRYSPREGTAAAAMPDRVPPPIARERSRRMHELGAELEERFRSRFVGRRMPVLWESSEPRGEGLRWSGLTGNYLRVVGDSPESVDLENRVVEVELCGSIPGALVGGLGTSVDDLRERAGICGG